MSIKLDKIDKHILQVLQRDGKIQNIELAKEVGLSPSPCLRRVRLLEESGVITRYVAVLDGSMVDAGLSLFARIWFRAQDAETIEEFVKAIKVLPEVVECHLMAGECDALIRIVTKDLATYRRFHADYLTQIPSIQSIKTEVPMETVKVSFALPL
ncbi:MULTISPECIES: Lrp/AsnC family transcriptional regulator [Proteus]|jgi:DNA-binding Lrp family transcriptional regulator|uniref:AsnC family transcriptional regulator n=1 Tax=Proteus vulgaris TaxID=585 RepID=A0A094VXC1_PROVU|nr:MULTISPECIES: Lrp/AsnC family transcriptional regulator [Proteus]MBG3080593.1 Lrp/AsnC family transcriptional regulator [Proteus mirabilis]NBN60687.1 winged helix-turn-helix transcriptional regulator [Proteus sp. G2639]AYY80801.1 Lrp/AsnC family transcriptional regulator [Proteus vulgaris]KGA60677.1 asnC family protein [Proteus vulgaris]MBG5969515.1 Lrp/AsnC family transcriptional regulator [Proteus vulgaris]